MVNSEDEIAPDSSRPPLRSRQGFSGGLADPKLYIGIVIVVTILALLSGISHKADLLCQFRAQIAGLLAIILVALIANYKNDKAPRLVAVTTVSLLLNLGVLGWTYLDFSRPPIDQKAPTISVLQFNVNNANTQTARFADLVKDLKPDVICLEEYSRPWCEAFNKDALRALYPYRIEKVRDDSFGVAIFSSRPFLNAKYVSFGKRSTPSASATVATGTKQIQFLVTHPVPPLTGEWWNERNAQFAQIAAYSKTASKNSSLVLCGDLNCVPWSTCFAQTLGSVSLHNTARGFAFQPTWPVNCWVLRIPLDYVLTSPDVHAKVFRVERDCGSDHLPVYVELSI